MKKIINFYKNNRRVINVTLFIIFLVIFGLRAVHRPGDTDLKQHWEFSRLMRTGKPIYNIDNNMSGYVYPPFSAFFHIPFTFLSFKVFRIIWYLICMLVLLICIYFCKKMILEKGFSTPSWVSVIAIMITARFIQHDIEYGQMNIIMLAMMMGSLYFFNNKKDINSAFLISLAASIKLYPVALIGYFFCKKRFKVVSYAILFIILFNLIIPLIIFGYPGIVDVYKDFIIVTKAGAKQLGDYNPGNQSLQSALFRFLYGDKFGPVNVSFLKLEIETINRIFYIFVLLTFGLTAFFCRPKFKNQMMIEAGLFIILILLFWKRSWIQNFVLLLLPNFVILKYITENRDDKFTFYTFAFIQAIIVLSVHGIAGPKIDFFCRNLSHLTFAAIVEYILLVRIKYLKDKV